MLALNHRISDRLVLRIVGLFMLVSVALGAGPVLAQDDERQRFPQVDIMSPLGVDMQSGQFIEQGTDLQIGPFVIDHYIRSRGPGPYRGIRASASFATSLHGMAEIIDNTPYGSAPEINVYVYLGRTRITFMLDSSGNFFPFDSSNTGWKMVKSGQEWVLTNKSGEEYRFTEHAAISQQSRKLASKRAADGHLLTYSYDSSARLSRVDSNRGYSIVLEYIDGGSSVRACGYNLAVTPVASTTNCNASGLSATYGYTGGRLASITRPDGSAINIAYQTDHAGTYPTCVTLPNSATCRVQIAYYRPPPGGLMPGTARLDHVIQQTTAEGEVWNYAHLAIENFSGDYQPYPGEVLYSFSFVTSPVVGGGASYTFGNGFLTQVSGALGEASYQYASNEVYSLLIKTGWIGPHYYSIFPHRVTYPEGNWEIFQRDFADNVVSRTAYPKPGSSELPQATTWTYPGAYRWSMPTICVTVNVLCDKPTRITDPRGNSTDMTYSATHGGVLTRTGPADVNGVRPQTRYSYAQKYAWTKSGTSYVQASAPVWVLASEEYCKTSTADANGNCAAGASDEVVTAYEYQNGSSAKGSNLLLLGTAVTANGTTLRTCFTYDDLGRKISETQPKAGLASCQ